MDHPADTGKMPEEFTVLEVEALEPQEHYNRREEEGREFWEGNANELVKAARTKAHMALQKRFKTSALYGAIFTKRFFFQKLRPELTAKPYAHFSRPNKETAAERQRIVMRIDLPLYYEEVVKPTLR